MKKIIIYLITGLLSIHIVSCDKFLDTLPDQRTEVNTPQKISELLVSAYPTLMPMMLTEHRTDNVTDNGVNFGTPNPTLIECYNWKNITDVTWDSPQMLWSACYESVASANQVLETIKELDESHNTLSQKGEALLCRAYAHFILVNVFSQAYNPQSSDSDMGIPYIKETEKSIGKKYDRGTVSQVYENIAKDIEEGFPLINDEKYPVPLYRFTAKASAAFAARFYLFYTKYDKVIKYANIAIGDNPPAVLRNLAGYSAKYTNPLEWTYGFISKDEPANLLLIATRSLYGRNYQGQRYGHSREIAGGETFWSSGPWGSVMSVFGNVFGSDQMVYIPKLNEMFEIKDAIAQTGQPHVVAQAFTTDETLLCRAEAEVMLKQYAAAAQDLSYWYVSKGGAGASAEQIADYYAKAPQGKRKALHPKFTIEEGTQENMIHAILHARRIETIHDGSRWYDIKRFGIEIEHKIADAEPILLKTDDPRRALQLPADVISAGLTANPQ